MSLYYGESGGPIASCLYAVELHRTPRIWFLSVAGGTTRSQMLSPFAESIILSSTPLDFDLLLKSIPYLLNGLMECRHEYGTRPKAQDQIPLDPTL